jgi:hypothetical protein
MTPLELVQSTSRDVNAAGDAFYFDQQTLDRGRESGLDGFRLYFLGRGGVLGDVEPDVVVAAFGYFAPAVVQAMWDSARQIMAPRDAARLYLDAAADFGRRSLDGLEGLDAFNTAAEAVIGAVDRSGLALFAGIAAEPLPDDAPARAYRNIVTLRELRGSVHLLAVVASGLRPAVAHAVRRPADVQMFGYDETPEVTDADRERWNDAEALTDRLLVPWYAVLDDGGAQAFAHGVRAISGRLPRS